MRSPLAQSGNAQNADVTIRNGTTSSPATPTRCSSTQPARGETFNLLVEDSAFSNNSAASPTADITGPPDFTHEQYDSGQRVHELQRRWWKRRYHLEWCAAFMNLNLGGNGADRNTASGGTSEYVLSELVGCRLNVFERDDTFANLRNTGTVVPLPNPAAFDDLPIAPTLPTVP